MDLLRLKGIAVKYLYGEMALFNVSFALSKGEKVAIVGDKDSGKTTLLKVLAGFTPVTSGEVLLDGQNADTLSPKDRDVLFVFDTNGLFWYKSARKNLEYSLKIRNIDKSTVKARVDYALKLFGLEHKAGKPVFVLNRFERACLQYARLFVRDAQIYLVDNLYDKLPSAERAKLLSILFEGLKDKSGSVVFATESLMDGLRFSENLLLLEEGMQVGAGTIKEMLFSPYCLGTFKMLGLDVVARQIKLENTTEPSVVYDGEVCKIDGDLLLDRCYMEREVLAAKYKGKLFLFDSVSEKRIYPIYW